MSVSNGVASESARVSTAIRFDPLLHKRLLAEAERRDVSVNYLVSRACERALERWEGQEL